MAHVRAALRRGQAVTCMSALWVRPATRLFTGADPRLLLIVLTSIRLILLSIEITSSRTDSGFSRVSHITSPKDYTPPNRPHQTSGVLGMSVASKWSAKALYFLL